MYTSLQSTKTGHIFDKVILITKHTENKKEWTLHIYNIYVYFKRCQNIYIYVLTKKSDQNHLFLNSNLFTCRKDVANNN